MIRVYVGFDPREEIAHDVCSFSIRRRSTEPVNVVTVKRRALEQAGAYCRPWVKTDSGYRDLIDGKPFSTEFSFTRFLVPWLNNYHDWAVFVDCDFLFLDDIAKLWALRDDRFAVMCVKHDQRPVEATKMDGVAQTAYPRKNWSSLVLWNCAHHRNAVLTPNYINNAAGSQLHGFSWLDDDLIGDVPVDWNWLSGVSKPLDRTPSAVHFTLGGPWFHDYVQVPFASEWLNEQQEMVLCSQ